MSERSRLSGWHPESAFRDLLEKIEGYINHPTVERNILMALQADVQKLVDEVAANSDLAKSNEAALTLLGTQITALQAQVGALQAGQILTAEDLTAIQGAVTTLGETNTGLQTAVPANAAPASGQAPTPAI